jgi:Helicase conserved C-terminal domain./DEAD/DEAH box helicase.
MSDLYAETARKMNEYILSRLDGSNDVCKRVLREANPSRYYIIGSLANLIEKNGIQRSSVQENAITLKFKIKESMTIPIEISYSIFVKDSLTEEEAIDNKIKNAWNRIDFKDNFSLSKNCKSYKLSFKNSNGDNKEYDVKVDYTEEKINNNELQITVCVHNDSVSEYPDLYVFNTRITLSVPKFVVIPYYYTYCYEGLKKHLSHTFRAINCTAYFNGDCSKIVTAPCPKYEQNKTKLKTSDKGFVFSFEKLSSENALDHLKKYNTVLEEYLSEYESIEFTPDESIEFSNAMDHFNQLCADYHDGVELIQNNSDVLYAFKLMNKTFKESSKYEAWRIFQIIFIVSSIPSIVHSEKIDTCDVIHIPTGGGKTEAYLGVVLFTMFYVRLIGKKYGTAAIVKFPLRMLSVQQVERVSTKVLIAEKIRKNECIGGDPFSAAFFVGKSDEFPNKTITAINTIKRAEPDSLEGKIITKCPLCDGKIVLRETKQNNITHHCLKCDTDHHLYYTDEEVYRYLPTVIISTVDKFSSVSWNRYMKSIFGTDLFKCNCGHGFFPVAEKCLGASKCTAGRERIDKDSVVVPKLIIQDELHLIRESFGTIDAHFESFCEEMQKTLSGTIPKRIAMTATITGCSEQIHQLYNKGAKIFPGPNPYSVINKRELNDPFFENEYDEKAPKLHRLIIGLKPNGRDNQYATNLSIKYAKEFINKLSSNTIEYGPGYDVDDQKAINLASVFCRMLTYHNKKSDVYSTNHFMDAVISSNLGSSSVMKKMLTGDNSTDEIRSVIDSIHNFDRNEDQQLHITSATNIVSHGVDLEEWNFMEFQGIPNNTAEYIQAMSRVGRKYSGLVYIWFYPNRVRDISFYHNFQEYHEIIDHKVEPVSINKWTKLSFMETCTSIFSATVINYLSAIHNVPIYNRDQFILIFGNGSDPRHKDEVIDFIHRVYRTSSDVDGAEEIRKEIASKVEERIKIVLNSPSNDPNRSYFPNIITKHSGKYFGMQLGMRGIQDTVIFRKDANSKEYQDRVE